MKKIVTNFASGYWYPRGQARLYESLLIHDKGSDFKGILSPEIINCPPHKEAPYAFKPHCLMHCKDLGYDMAIFADASIYAVGSWQPIWDLIEKNGYYIEEAGHWAGTWTKDSVLKKHGLTRDDAMKIPMFSAGFIGLNFHSKIAMDYLEQWYTASRDGDSFLGKWDNKDWSVSADERCEGHRHDMSVGSILAHKLGMVHGRGGTFLSYIGTGYGKPSETSCAHLRPVA